MKCQKRKTKSRNKLPPFRAETCVGKIKRGKDGWYTPRETKNGMWVWRLK